MRDAGSTFVWQTAAKEKKKQMRKSFRGLPYAPKNSSSSCMGRVCW